MKPLILAAVLALAVLAPLAAADPEYPNTEPGRHAREYFPAYNGGEATMRAYFAAHVGPVELKARPVDARIDIWHQIQANNGALTPLRVLELGDDFVTVLVRNGNGESASFRFNCRPEAPHTLVGIMVQPADEEVGAHAAPAAPPPPAGPPPTDAEIVTDLSAQLDSLVHSAKFSGVARLDKGGQTLFAKAYGMASRRMDRPNTMETRFNLGSINKIFTQTAIQQLAEQGKLKLDDPVAKYLPDYPKEAAQKITIRMLMEHRGGVPDVLTNAKLWEHPADVRTASDWYALVRGMPLNFKPGTKQEYSNGGYVMLGMIVERVSGEDYYAYIRKHIYGPAGMTRSDSYTPQERGDDFAIAYSRHPEGRRPAVHGDDTAEPEEATHPFGRASAAGGGYSTAGDLVRFADAMRAGKLLKSASGESAGLGIAGGSPGVNALLEMSGPYTLVVLANVDPPAAERFGATTGRMIRRALGRPEGETKRVGGGGAH